MVLKVRLDDGRKSFFGYAQNISRGGMFISTVSPREPGEVFTVETPLPLPQPMTIQCRCEVVWKRPYSRKGCYEPGMGLKFIDLPEDVAKAIDDWIRSVG